MTATEQEATTAATAAPVGHTKCPCCNNPWASATGDFFSNMVCQVCDDDVKGKEGKGLSRRNLDESVRPHENFYRYSNGGWIASNPIPQGYPNWNTFLTLHVQSQENLKATLERLALEGDAGTEDDGDEDKDEKLKLRAFYEAAMDEDRIEQSGFEPLRPLLQFIDDEIVAAHAAGDFGRTAQLLGVLSRRFGVNCFFSTGTSPDAKNSNWNLCQLAQGGLVSTSTI